MAQRPRRRQPRHRRRHSRAAAAVAAEVEEIAADNDIFVVSNEDVAQAEGDVTAAEEAVAQANAAAAEASNAVSTAQDERPSFAPTSSKHERGRHGTGGAPAGESLCARIARSSLGPRKGRRRRRLGAGNRLQRLRRLGVRLDEGLVRDVLAGTPSVPPRRSPGPPGRAAAATPVSTSRGSELDYDEFSFASTAPIHAASVLPPASRRRFSSHRVRNAVAIDCLLRRYTRR